MVVRWLNLTTQLLALAIVWVPDSSSNSLCGQEFALSGVPINTGRRLAADAINVIPPGGEYGDTFEGPIDLPFLTSADKLAGTPNYAAHSETLLGMSKNVVFRHEIWSFEFSFKPVRMISIDMRNDRGEVGPKIVWYLLYRVRYLGGDLQPTPSKDSAGNEVYVQPVPSAGRETRRFMPSFVLNATALEKRFQSRFIPEALGPIAEKERVGKPVYDSIAIQKVPVPLWTSLNPENEVWGVATWTDIDPRTDFFAVEIRGLTNAQKSQMVNGELVSKQKTLVLNFSRPGDTVNELLDRIRYGVPPSADPEQQKAILRKLGLTERLDHYWIYR